MITNTASVERISPDQATDILAHENFENQRNIAEHHVNFLQTVMENGEFDSGEPIRFAVLGANRYLINGQHRLRAISRRGVAQEIVVVTSHCDTAEEVARLYARIDRGRGRSMADALRALGMVGHEGDLNQRQVGALMSCAPVFAQELRATHVTGSSYASKSAEGRLERMEPWMDAAKRFFDAVQKCAFGNDALFYRRDVAVVGIATFGDAPASDHAREFWRGMALDDGLASDDPRKQALEFIKRKRGTFGANTSGKNRASIGEVAHGVTLCWNAWVRGDNIKQIRIPDARAPLKIAGTRFAKRDEEGNVIQGRRPAGAVDTYVPKIYPSVMAERGRISSGAAEIGGRWTEAGRRVQDKEEAAPAT